ncbi:MAG: RidA family protein [Acidimicrobiales bacterium]|nr:RidA family protein [Acidimicrobiales bacterium]
MSDQAPKPVGPYTPVVRAGDWLICSGQVPLKDGKLVEGGIAEATRQCVANLGAQLETHGARLEQVVKTTVFLTDMADYAAMNEAYMGAFGPTRPARSAVAVKALPLGAGVEIEAWAHAPQRD